MQIAFLCSEYEGLLKTGGLADATRGLAQALRQRHERLEQAEGERHGERGQRWLHQADSRLAGSDRAAWHPGEPPAGARRIIHDMADPTPSEVRTYIAAGLPCQHLDVEGDGRHFFATIVSAEFEGKRAIQRHQRVYATLGAKMHTDEVHALSMKTFTPAEWAAQAQ